MMLSRTKTVQFLGHPVYAVCNVYFQETSLETVKSFNNLK